DAAAGSVTFTTASGITGTTLPAAAAANTGRYVVATVAGTYTPTGGTATPTDQGDWFLSDGTAWVHVNVGPTMTGIAAANIAVSPAVAGGTNVQAALSALEAGTASLNSPALTGTPTAPTAAPLTNTTQIATTAFVMAESGTKAPLA